MFQNMNVLNNAAVRRSAFAVITMISIAALTGRAYAVFTMDEGSELFITGNASIAANDNIFLRDRKSVV